MINYLYGVLLIVAIALICFALLQYTKTSKLLNEGIKTNAIVIEFVEESGDDGNTFKPVFEYFDRNNFKHIFRGEVGSNPPAYKLNEEVAIVYNPNEIDDQKVVSYWGLYRSVIISLSIASPLLIISCGFFLYSTGNMAE